MNTLWGKLDQANSSPAWGPNLVQQTANSVNRSNLYNNVTANAIMTNNTTAGIFGVSPAEKSGSGGVGSVTITAPGTGFTVRPLVAFSGGTGGNAAAIVANTTAKVVSVVMGTANGSGYRANDTVTIAGGTSTTAAEANVIQIGTIAGQNNVSFNNTGANGTFTGGANYAVSDKITLVDGTVANVVTVSANAVLTFTLTSRSTIGNTTNSRTIAQANTTGVGTGFTLTLANNNQSVFNVAIQTAGAYTVLPTLSDNQPTGGTGSGLKVTVAFGVGSVTISNTSSGFTAAPTVAITGTGATGQTAVAVLQTGEGFRATSAGWQLRTVDSKGRIRYETLVAMKSITANTTGHDADDAILPQ